MTKSDKVQRGIVHRNPKISFHDVVVDFPTTKLCKKIQILQKFPEDVELFHLNPPKSKGNINTK